jgi:hypothetical protein
MQHLIYDLLALPDLCSELALMCLFNKELVKCELWKNEGGGYYYSPT